MRARIRIALSKQHLPLSPNLKRLIAFCLYYLLLQPFASVAAAIPSLIDVAVVNSPTGFALEPSDLQFQQHQDYLFVINNNNPESLTFHFSQFGQKVMTHYLHGTPSVSQESIELPGKSKVLWQFSALGSGEFDYYISYASQNIKGLTSKMTIHPIQETPVRKPAEEVLAVTSEPVKTPPETENIAEDIPEKKEKRGSQSFGRKH